MLITKQKKSKCLGWKDSHCLIEQEISKLLLDCVNNYMAGRNKMIEIHALSINGLIFRIV